MRLPAQSATPLGREELKNFGQISVEKLRGNKDNCWKTPLGRKKNERGTPAKEGNTRGTSRGLGKEFFETHKRAKNVEARKLCQIGGKKSEQKRGVHLAPSPCTKRGSRKTMVRDLGDNIGWAQEKNERYK